MIDFGDFYFVTKMFNIDNIIKTLQIDSLCVV